MSTGVTLIQTTSGAATGGKHDPGNFRAASVIAGFTAGSGVRSATVVIEGSNDGTNWIQLASLAPTDTAPAGGTITVPYGFIRARTTAISGTAAEVAAFLTAV